MGSERGLSKWVLLPDSPRPLQQRERPDFKSSSLSPIFPFRVVQDHSSSCLKSQSEQTGSTSPAETAVHIMMTASRPGANAGWSIRMLLAAPPHVALFQAAAGVI